MSAVFAFLADHPALLLFGLIGIGSAVGAIKIRSMALGSAAVLFVAIAVSATGSALGVPLAIPELVASLGLALFTFSVGVQSGSSFFNNLRSSGKALAGAFLALVVAAALAYFVGPLLGLTADQAAGTFAGAVTNTPALAATGGSSEATVGYSVAYIFGVIGMMIMINISLRHRGEDSDAPAELITRDIRVERTDNPLVKDIEASHGAKVRITRIRQADDSEVQIPVEDDVLQQGAVVTVVGPKTAADALTRSLGHASSHHLTMDRTFLDFRRVTISNPNIAGRRIADVDLEDKYRATIARVRRGDVDMVGNPELVLELGDRVRIVAPQAQITEVSTFLGDSSRGLTNINPLALGIGLALGYGLGTIPIPMIGGGTVHLGSALGALIVGLIMGRIGRIGTIITTLPFTASTVLAEIGLLLFLAQAGVKAGGGILTAFSSGAWLGMLGLGAIITLAAGTITYFWQRSIVHMGGTRLSGFLAGNQTHPALLAYANGRTDHDFRVSAGYAMVYPLAMVTKILLGSILGMLS